MRQTWSGTVIAFVLAAAALAPAAVATADHRPAGSIPHADLIEPKQLADSLKGSTMARPLLLHVGFRTLYTQAHIPNSEYVGPASDDAGLSALRSRVAAISRDSPIVIYCGCCPWERCPNIAAAYEALHAMGFTHVKALHIADDFGASWADKGYPVTKGD